VNGNYAVSFEIRLSIKNDPPLAMVMFTERYTMLPEGIWGRDVSGRGGRGGKASVKSTREATSDTVASYAIFDEQGTRKRFSTTANEPQ
jgi:hypothetical protein